jgi:hypothetical protein
MSKKQTTFVAEDTKQPPVSAVQSASIGQESKSKTLFYLALSLPAPLTDVTGDSKKHTLAKSLLTPLDITQESIPEHLVCQFTEQIFAEPVFTSAGEVYESELVTKWLTDHNYDPKHTESPLESKKLNPANRVLPVKLRVLISVFNSNR